MQVSAAAEGYRRKRNERSVLRRRGPLVKRLRRGPLTPQTWVRFPHGSPFQIALRTEKPRWRNFSAGAGKRGAAGGANPNQSVSMTARVHPFPFRTRKLSSSVAKILVWRRTGKIARCRHGNGGHESGRRFSQYGRTKGALPWEESGRRKRMRKP